MNKFTFNIKNEQFSFHFNKFCFVNQKKKKESNLCNETVDDIHFHSTTQAKL